MKRKALFTLVFLLLNAVQIHWSISFAQTPNADKSQASQKVSESDAPELVLPVAHLFEITAVTYSPLGEVLVTAGGDDKIIFWNAKTGNSLRVLENYPKIKSLSYSRDGTYLVAWGEGPVVLNADTGERLELLPTLPADFEFTPDSKSIIGSVEDETKVWSIATKKEIHTFAGSSFSVSSDSHRVATMGDGKIKVWNLITGDEIRTFAGTSYMLSSDGKRLAARQEPVIKVWNIDTNEEIHSFPTMPFFLLSSNSKRLATSDNQKSVKLWDVDTGAELAAVQFPKEQGKLIIEFSADSKFVAIVGGVITSRPFLMSPTWTDNTIRLLNAETGAQITNLTSPINDEISFVEISPDSRVLSVVFSQRAFLGSDPGLIVVWDLIRGRELHTLKGHSEAINSVSYSPDGQTLASVSGAGLISFGAIRLWDVRSGSSRVFRSQTSNPLGLDASLEPAILVTGNLDMEAPGGDFEGRAISDTNGIRLWDVATGKDTQVLPMVTPAVAVSRDAKLLAALVWISTEDDKTRLSVIDIASGVETHNFDQGMSHNMLALSPDGKRVATSGEETSEITLWNLATKEKQSWPGDGPISFSANGEFLVYQEVGGIVFRDVVTGSKTPKTIPFSPALDAIAVSPDGTFVAGAAGEKIHVWNIKTGTDYTLDYNEAASLSFSFDSKKLAAGGQPMKVWNANDGKELALLEVNGALNSIVRFGADSNILVSTSLDKRVRIWDIQNRKELAELIAIDKKDWVAITPDGLFDGSPGSFSQIFWRFSESLFDVAPVEAYFNEFYYPGLLTDIFSGVRPVAPANISEKDRRQIPLRIKAVGKPDLTVPVTDRSIPIEIEVEEAPAGRDRFKKDRPLPASGVKDIRLFRNGTLVKSWRGQWGNIDGCKLQTTANPRRAVCSANVSIVAGENRFIAYAFNDDNVKSANALLTVKGANRIGDVGTTHILAIGINEYAQNEFFDDLSYAERDAETFSDKVTRGQKQVPRKTNVIPPILGKRATKEEILSTLRSLARVNPEDTVVVYFAGHGLARKDGRFYLIPHDVGYSTMAQILEHSISDLNLEDAFREIDAEQILLILDSCDSGQALESKEERRRGPMNSKGLGQLAYEKGMYVLAAAQPYQIAFEPNELKGGLMTNVLLNEALTGLADNDRDNKITNREWFDYTLKIVPNKQRDKVEQAKKQGKTLRPQTPRVFYRREPDTHPFVMMVLARQASN